MYYTAHYFLVVTASGIFMALSSAAEHSYFEQTTEFSATPYLDFKNAPAFDKKSFLQWFT
ncbi:MAG: hypothetical protein KJ808_10335 [Acidobacteria bacterium]|nr:hypothetical protein [Acidobacteriota bacterium]MBU4307544.1 hypothetical protein [Acidobacteriota bacterium]MCG2811271.1 hypothetical protein [Candidatus Aminicenantes bacterium]